MLNILSCVSGPSVCPPWRSVCSGPLPIFLIGFFVFLVWSRVSSLYILEIIFLSDVHLQIYFPVWLVPCSFCCSFLWLCSRFYCDEVPFVYSFLYVPCSRGHISEKMLCRISVISCLSSLELSWCQNLLKSFFHLEFIFAYDISWWSSFIFLHVAVQMSLHHLLNRLFLLHFMLLPPLSNITWP